MKSMPPPPVYWPKGKPDASPASPQVHAPHPDAASRRTAQLKASGPVTQHYMPPPSPTIPPPPTVRPVAAVIQRMDIEVTIDGKDVGNYIFGKNDYDHEFYSLLDWYYNSGKYGKLSKEVIAAAMKRYRDAYPRGRSKRIVFGYVNPTHDSQTGLDLLERGAMSPQPSTRDRKSWLLSPSRRFQTFSPNSRNPDTIPSLGHSSVVFGHDEGASEHFNRIGHTQTPEINKAWNKQITTFHGLENKYKSAASGSNAPNYCRPEKNIGSHPMYWNKKHKDYNDEFQS
ncbi:hypothetical protein [Azospirillum sp. sgz301742]